MKIEDIKTKLESVMGIYRWIGLGMIIPWIILGIILIVVGAMLFFFGD